MPDDADDDFFVGDWEDNEMAWLLQGVMQGTERRKAEGEHPDVPAHVYRRLDDERPGDDLALQRKREDRDPPAEPAVGKDGSRMHTSSSSDEIATVAPHGPSASSHEPTPTALGAAIYEAKFSLVSTMIPPTDWRYNSAPAKKAIEKQMKGMVDHGVWDPASLCEASDVKGPAEFVGGKLLLGIKGAESLGDNQGPETVQWKARFVCTGNFISDANGRKVYEFDSPFAMPIDLASVRAVIYYGAQHRCILQADVLTAYLLAKLGGPPTYIRLPRWALPAAAQSMKDPVMRLHKALYGHPRSGGDWGQHLGRVLRAQG